MVQELNLWQPVKFATLELCFIESPTFEIGKQSLDPTFYVPSRLETGQGLMGAIKEHFT